MSSVRISRFDWKIQKKSNAIQSRPKTGLVSIWTTDPMCMDEEIWGLLTKLGCCWTLMCCMCCCWPPEWMWCCCCCCCCCCCTAPKDGTTSIFSLCSISSRFLTCLRSLARRFWNQILTYSTWNQWNFFLNADTNIEDKVVWCLPVVRIGLGRWPAPICVWWWCNDCSEIPSPTRAAGGPCKRHGTCPWSSSSLLRTHPSLNCRHVSMSWLFYLIYS